MRRRIGAVGLAAAVVMTVSGTAHADPSWTAPALPVTGNAALTGVTAVDAHTTWAYGVGVTRPGRATEQTPLLLSHDDRDGAAGWRQVPVPAFGDTSNQIGAVDALSARDAWMVNNWEAGRGGILTHHWDGTAWTPVTAPVPAAKLSDGGLLDVSVRAADDAWAVGWVTIIDSERPNPDKPGGVIYETHAEAVIEHWDGTSWRIVPAPDATGTWLNSVTALAEDDVWVSGYTDEDTPLLQHWDGTAWTVYPVAYQGINGELTDLEARGPDDIWAAGRVLLDEEDRGHGLVAHWDGTAWKQVRVPAGTGRVNDLSLTPTGVAVVGEAPDGAPYALRRAGGCWTALGVPGADPATAAGRSLSSVARTRQGLVLAGWDDEAATGLPDPVLLTH